MFASLFQSKFDSVKLFKESGSHEQQPEDIICNERKSKKYFWQKIVKKCSIRYDELIDTNYKRIQFSFWLGLGCVGNWIFDFQILGFRSIFFV